MKTFVNGVINELSNNENLKDNSVIKIITESTKSCLETGEGISKAYNNLKSGLIDINEHLKSDDISNILSQFDKFEKTDRVKVSNISKELGLSNILENVKNSAVYSDPIVMHQVSLLEDAMERRNIPDHRLYGEFINRFNNYTYDNAIKESIKLINNYIDNNKERLLVLDAIYEMGDSPLYAADVEKLTEMLLKESFTSEVIRLKLNANLPVINELTRNLATLEAAKSPDFSLGRGNENCKVETSILPAIKVDESTLLTFMDNRFFFIGKNRLVQASSGNVDKITEADGAKMSEVYPDFYKVCESFNALNFKSDGPGITSTGVRNFEMSFRVNESGTLDIYINETKIEDPSSYDFNSVLSMENPTLKQHVSKVLENTGSIFNFEFIKKIINESTGKEAFIIEMDKQYHVCEKLNQVERQWTGGLNEFKLYKYILENFNYDISPIFKFQIEDELQNIKMIESKKAEITNNISLLEGSISELDEAIDSGEIDSDYISELEDIKEQLESKILGLKEKFIELDLKKKESLA